MAEPKQITLEQLGNFSIDDAGRLYWKNKVVQTESVVVLSGKQTTWGIVIAVATVLGALAAITYSVVYVYTVFRTPPLH